uniref:Uncharacterized protein n=1 Tax=uncultured marine group II/III euryarchaeote SAT1000_53_H10 TaxID=1456590 RepID=A0A075IFC9_9EURY|nr:hypothetical protein [uncultured marine group II/III euryarchaeote SAT1000_53_H10]
MVFCMFFNILHTNYLVVGGEQGNDHAGDDTGESEPERLLDHHQLKSDDEQH